MRIAKPRRSAEGVRLDGFLAESAGPIRDPDLSNFTTVSAFSSSQSGSGQPPDRAQICPMCVRVCPFNIFFADPILDQQNGILVEETRKETSKKVILR